MISVGSRDERKKMMMYGFEGEKMEFEEEEAYFQHNNNYNDDDSSIDPDLSLSYIDEKLQDVLGHCQKDFEGGVSAENLGAKFGGYGSFLPTYQRSPVCSHPKTPAKVLTYSAPVSPNNAHKEVGHQNSVSQSSASKPVRNGSTSFRPRSGSALRSSKSNAKLKKEVLSSSGERSKSVRNFTNDSDPKSLRVRIKVGSDKLSTQRNAEIYSGLGLDVSPSSSLEVSPVDSDGFLHVAQVGPNESPTSILEMMTSFPVSGSLLLSPLPYDVLHLTEKKLEDDSCGPVHKGSQESTVTALHGSDLVKVDRNVLGEKSKSSEKNSVSMESTNGNDIRNATGVTEKKGSSVDHLTPKNKTPSSGLKRKSEDGSKSDSFTSKNKDKSHGLKSYKEDLKKDSGKARETYKDFFGELDIEHDHDELTLEKPSEFIYVKGTGDNSKLLRENLNRNESKKISSFTMGNGLESDAVAPMVVPVVNEDWVGCDKCNKWRLLPPGVNPGSLPEKWKCSMLDWLPGMNRCGISEEETTKATTSRFPGPAVQGPQPVHPSGPRLGVIPLDALGPDGTHQNFGSEYLSSGVKKKHGLKDFPIEAKQDRPSLSSNSSKKKLNTSCKTRSLNAASHSPLVNETEFLDSGHSHDVITEEDRLKQTEINKLRESFAVEGDIICHSNIGNKRERTRDFPKDFKKAKRDGDESFHMGKFDERDVARKRKKVNELDGAGNYNKETSETNHRKEKRARVLKSSEGVSASKTKSIEDLPKDTSRRDTVLAATSSSSKVSGSVKMNTNKQEAKGSPVESVSSSPMRISNLTKFPSPRRNSRDIGPLTKNVNGRAYEEKSRGGKNKSLGKFAKGSSSKESPLTKNVNARSSQDSKKPSKKDVYIKGKSSSLPPKGFSETERKEHAGNTLSLKGLKENKKQQSLNGNQPINVKNPSPNRNKGRNLDPTAVLVRELSNQATTDTLREAKSLKHMADRLKNGGSDLESRALYIEATLKFLHGASLFESIGKSGEMIQSVSIYKSTAKLCEFCAHEYERTKEMTTAALAYKCMEAAYMKVIYHAHATTCKDVNELKTSLQIAPKGESPPSASASDLDNLNNPATIDKASALAKVVNTPVPRKDTIAAENKPNFTRILSIVDNVNLAMEASRKSQTCFAASSSKDEAVLSAVKKVLDFGFHDMEELLQLIRVALEVINSR
uniref:cysteine-tryptophan domain-containing zinc finger protein 5-like n=1 Tax=Erigeron canadensis TaxID=72917 RepID=UPI001CB90E20|nr:cysteine-tryptophan domain-containing zinc finger protein 5-like [Erigeron canadensis]XP_043635604.1 cysteine-tryptophan domain-containing zinc finger protein 5-like [Erigeron canadensis]